MEPLRKEWKPWNQEYKAVSEWLRSETLVA